MRTYLLCVSAALLWPGSGIAANTPQDIAKDFCHAVAAQALCGKYLVMDKTVESRLEQLAGGKLRGKTSPLNPLCEAGYNEYYKAESALGLEKSCKAVVGLFGPQGTRRAGLVTARTAPAMKLPQSTISIMVKDLCYAASVARACPGVSLSKGVEERLNTQSGVKLRDPKGYFSTECGSGTYRASLARGKTSLPEFCARSLVAYGKTGNIRAGLLSRTADLAARPATPKPASAAAPRPAPATQPAPAKSVTPAASPAPAPAKPVAKPPARPAPAPALAPAKSAAPVVAPAPVPAKPVAKPPARPAYAPPAPAAPALAAPLAPARPAAPLRPVAPSQYNLVILTQLPPLAAGKTPTSILGAVPGTLGPQACRAIQQRVARAGQNLRAARTFATQTRQAILYTAEVKAASSLCPTLPAGRLPEAVLAGAINTGLDACPVVLQTIRDLNAVATGYRKKSMYRGLFGITQAKLWAMERMQGSCSRYTQGIMKSTLKYTRKAADRERKSYTCRIWQNLFYSEMKAVRALSSKKAIAQALRRLDSRAAAAIHGERAACENPSYAASSEKQWLSTRKYLQLRMGQGAASSY
ncbi:MAG TPA: hypothetical protein ENJ57_00930 [Rhizobiales bacterium]|nr:hypothetical protein [Hyphomicrobiales bacterium]